MTSNLRADLLKLTMAHGFSYPDSDHSTKFNCSECDEYTPCTTSRLVGALTEVLDSVTEIIDEKVNYGRMQGYEIHQHDGEVQVAKSILLSMREAWDGR